MRNGRSSKRRTSKGTDPLLQSYYWTKVVRPHWKRPENRRPCARCGLEIDYDAARFIPGTRRVNPESLVVGHIVGRHQAKRMGWTDAQIQNISNTQPEHAACSDRSGAQYLNSLKTPLRSVPTGYGIDASPLSKIGRAHV